MREIKFRAKRFDNNHDDWIYGYLHVIDTVGHGFTGKAIQQQFGESRPYSVQVHPKSVGQFTGLKDKSGKEIYEGDIIKLPDDYDTFGINAGEIYEVYFGFGGFRMKAKYTKNRGFWLEDDGEYEKLGNIYENPELLEGEE